MTKDEFFETFVTKEKKKRKSPLSGRKVNYSVLRNAWSIPGSFLTRIRILFPRDSVIELLDPPENGVGFRLTYKTGVLELNATFLGADDFEF